MSNVVLSAAAFIPAVAQLAAKSDNLEPFAQYGLLGLILAWFMMKADKRLGGIEAKMVGLNRTMLIEVLSRPTTTERGKKMCREELRKIDPALVDEIEEG